MDAGLWTYLYVQAVVYGAVCLTILSIPRIMELEPGEGITSRQIRYTIVAIVAVYILGLIVLT